MESAQRRIDRLSTQLLTRTPMDDDDGASYPLVSEAASAKVSREILVHPRPKRPEVQWSPAEIKSKVGQEIGVSEWFEVTQDRVNDFADTTIDHNWIHVDVERSQKESPFGGTIAHGFLTLSLLPQLVSEVMPKAKGIRMGLNYGINKLRFVSPLIVGSRIRARVALAEIVEIPGNGIQLTLKVAVERENHDKPVLTVEWLTRYYF